MKQFYISILLCCALSASGQVNESLRAVDELINASQYEEARTKLDDALAATPDGNSTTLLQNKKAELLILQGKLDDADKILGSLKEKMSANAITKAITLTNSGFLYLNKGRSDVALEQLLEGLALFQQ